MSFPKHNNIFQNRNFDGYKVFGRCRVISDYDFKGQVIRPLHGTHMALMDDPLALGSDGLRKDKGLLKPGELTSPATPQPFDTSGIWLEDNSDSVIQGSDGACLEISGITIKDGQSFFLHYYFLKHDDRPDMNDFAVIQVRDDNSGKALISQKKLITKNEYDCDLIKQRWRDCSWFNTRNRTVTLRIIVSNGFIHSRSSNKKQQERSKALPSGLLVDGIFLI